MVGTAIRPQLHYLGNLPAIGFLLNLDFGRASILADGGADVMRLLIRA